MQKHCCYFQQKHNATVVPTLYLSAVVGLLGMLHCFSSKHSLQLEPLIMLRKCLAMLRKLLLRQEHQCSSHVKTCEASPYRCDRPRCRPPPPPPSPPSTCTPYVLPASHACTADAPCATFITLQLWHIVYALEQTAQILAVETLHVQS